MTTMAVQYLGELRTEATHLASGSTLLTDAPKDNQGKGEAFSPTDLLASSLASCMFTIMGIRARALGVDLAGMSCEVEKMMQASPRKVAEIRVRVQWSQLALTEAQRTELKQAALTCPVYLSLDPQLVKTILWE